MLCVEPDLLKGLSCMYAVHDVLTAGREGDEGRGDFVTGYMEVVKPAIESVLAVRLEDIVRNSCKNWLFFKRVTYCHLFGVRHSRQPVR